jgi:type II secretory pathway component GspD/PulD (secretin)
LIAATGDTFNRSVDSTQQTIYCDLDKTMVIAGSKKIAQATQKSGLPFLRNVPVLKWFVSEEADSKAETRLLILVSPRLLKNDPSVEIEIPLQDETAKTYKDAQTDNKTLEEEKNEKKSWWRKLF